MFGHDSTDPNSVYQQLFTGHVKVPVDEIAGYASDRSGIFPCNHGSPSSCNPPERIVLLRFRLLYAVVNTADSTMTLRSIN